MDDNYREALRRIEKAAETGAKKLNLFELNLTKLPPELWQLTSLQRLDSSRNQLSELPAEIGQLINLQELNYSHNQLSELPGEIGQLTNLRELYIRVNQISELPVQIGQLTNLQRLYLSGNKLSNVPAEIGQLTNLLWLCLRSNQLNKLPAEIGQLISLQWLYLSHNQLSKLPAEIGHLTNLQELYLHDNHLGELPAEIGHLTNLQVLYISGNQLVTLLPEICQLTSLESLNLSDNPLTSPPPEIARQGLKATLDFLREQLKQQERQWVSKLIVVGEGGVGKTSLLKRLRGETFNPDEDKTEGIAIREVEIEHPEEDDVIMILKAWDFGGQDILHATHQFFLTQRSLFLLVWNARLGYEQGRLYYWLDTIKARAPESPVLLVATHIDQHSITALPMADIQRKYPQVLGQIEISNQTGAGIGNLYAAIQSAAAKLPLMGGMWPATWLRASETIRTHEEKHITTRQMWDIMAQNGVDDDSRPRLAVMLHELGDILYHPEDRELQDLVILKPQWVSQHISRVLNSDQIDSLGIFTRDQINTIWHDIPTIMHECFLRLMERFDLSYRIPDDPENRSLIVERLPIDEVNYHARWKNILEKYHNCPEITMNFRLGSTMPAGIPTWFIARSHRFTTNTHWRYGALFADKEQQHLGLVKASPGQNPYVQLTVRGPYPQYFFSLLREGFELTLARFPGLDVRRMIPCPGSEGQLCEHEFDFEQLRSRIRRYPPRYEIECPSCLEIFDVRQLLYGLIPATQDTILAEVRAAREEDEERFITVMAYLQREFTNSYHRQQAIVDEHCPNTFVLYPEEKGWLPNPLGQKMHLQLFCQAPGCWHPTEDGGLYTIHESAKWLREIAPHLQRLVKYLKYVTPIVGPWLGVINPNYAQELAAKIKLTEALTKQLPEIRPLPGSKWTEELEDPIGTRYEGAELRALRQLLDDLDHDHNWGGLQKILTPEGHYLWLCDYHAQEYR